MRLLAAFITLALLGYILYSYDLGQLTSLVSGMSWHQFGVLAALLFANLFLVCFRFHVILKRFGVNVAFGSSFRANIYSQISGLFLLQIVGQFLGRTAFLKKHNVAASAVASITMYEKIISLAASSVFLFGGLYYLLGRNANDVIATSLQHIPLIHIGVISLLAVVLSYRLGALRFERQLWRRLFSWQNLWWVLYVTFLTLVSQACMVASYVMAAQSLSSAPPLAGLVAAASVVMFMASLPISVSGWGVREMSSVYALGLLGVSANDAVVVSIFIGFAALLALFAVAAGVSFQRDKAKIAVAASAAHARHALAHDNAAIALLTAFCCVAVFFQLHFPIRGAEININMADPLALMGGAFFLFRMILRKELPRWRAPHVNLSLAGITAALIVAFFVGVISFGVTPWAVNNRLAGWLVLLCYFMTGALVASQWGGNGTRRVLEALLAAGAVVSLYLIITAFLLGHGLGEFQKIYVPHFKNMSPNRNAMAFQLLIAFSGALALANRAKPQFLLVLTGLVTAGIIIAASRAGMCVALGLLALGLIMRVISLRRILLVLVLAVAVLAPVFIQIQSLQAGKFSFAIKREFLETSLPSSNAERLESLTGGVAMWREHPLVGAGLGAFMADHSAKFGRPLVIHNTALWILAEFGVFGFAVFAGVFLSLFMWSFRAMSKNPRAFLPAALFLMLCAFGVFSMAHDVFYQRIIWLMLGALLARRIPFVSLKAASMPRAP